jgi:ornithine cyclodeaminase/alanine dehydrogenase-like protein (mu-crystallin family)
LLLLSEADVARLLDVRQLIDALAGAFMELSAGRASVPARIAARTPDGLLAAMPGYVGGMLATKLVTLFPANHDRGLPSHQALIAVFDAATGTPTAVMDGTHITAMRTAAASALATRTLARPDAEVLAIVGAGVQARSHLAAMRALHEWREIRVASRTAVHARALADELQATAIDSTEAAVRGADVVCLCTHSAEPVIQRRWLAAGTHLNSVGYGDGPEVDAATIDGAAVLAVESRAAFSPPPAGCHELAGRDPAQGTELGEILAGRQGRTSPEELTVYKSMGHAVEDATAASLVERAARAAGAGHDIEL